MFYLTIVIWIIQLFELAVFYYCYCSLMVTHFLVWDIEVLIYEYCLLRSIYICLHKVIMEGFNLEHTFNSLPLGFRNQEIHLKKSKNSLIFINFQMTNASLKKFTKVRPFYHIQNLFICVKKSMWYIICFSYVSSMSYIHVCLLTLTEEGTVVNWLQVSEEIKT